MVHPLFLPFSSRKTLFFFANSNTVQNKFVYLEKFIRHYGKLGCINDMIQRDKENRELRKLGRERRKERLDRMYYGKKLYLSERVTADDMKQAQQQIADKQAQDLKREVISAYLVMGICTLLTICVILFLLN